MRITRQNNWVTRKLLEGSMNPLTTQWIAVPGIEIQGQLCFGKRLKPVEPFAVLIR